MGYPYQCSYFHAVDVIIHSSPPRGLYSNKGVLGSHSQVETLEPQNLRRRLDPAKWYVSTPGVLL